MTHPCRAGACPSRRFCAAPFDWGGFRRPGGEPLLERSKRGEKIAGGRLRRAPSGALSRPPPGPPFTGELGSEAWWKCTGAGWPLTHYLSPARCHCAAKPEGYPCYPLRTRLPGRSPVVRRVSVRTTFPMFTVGAGPRPARSMCSVDLVGADTPGWPLLPLWGNSPSVLIGPRAATQGRPYEKAGP